MEVLVFVFFGIVFLLTIRNIIDYFAPLRRETEIVEKDDELQDGKLFSELEKLSSDPDEGILGSCFIKEDRIFKFYTSTSDRAVVLGPPGTGKTSFLINQIYMWAESGRSFVALDVKPEIHKITRERLEKKGYKCIVYNPSKPTNTYDFLQDLQTPEMIGELASALIPSDKAENAVFNETAKDLLEAIISHFNARTGRDRKPPTLPEVYDFMSNCSSFTELVNNLKNSKSKQTKAIINNLTLISGNERLLSSIIATFNAQLRFMRYDNIRHSLSGISGENPEAFSLSELLKPKVALFLQFEESEKTVTGHLFSVFVGHLLRYLISNTDREAVFCLLDEIGNAGTIMGLTEKLNTIRSRNMPTWLYFQSMEQMQRYGQVANEGANTIMGACDFQMCFRANDISTAEWFSKRVGSHLVRHVASNRNSSDSGASVGNTYSYMREEVLFPHDLQQLGDGDVISIYRGKAWKGIAVPYWKINWERFDNPPPKVEPKPEEPREPSPLEIAIAKGIEKAKEYGKKGAEKGSELGIDYSKKAFNFSKKKYDEYMEKKAENKEKIND